MTEPLGRRVALVGTAPSSIHAPIKDPSWEIWGVGFRGEHMTRVNRWYELHRLSGLADGPDWNVLMKEWGKDCDLWMIWPEEDFGPRVRLFPHRELGAKYGTFFMTSSFAWMLAHAIEENAQAETPEQRIREIGIWGVDMEYDTEYREQRPGVRHFTALARFAGIKTTLLVNGGVIYEPIPYPFWQDDPLLAKLDHRKKNFTAERDSREAQVNTINERLLNIAGALSVLSDQEQIDRLKAEEGTLRAMLPKLQQDAVWCRGALDEIAWSVDYLKP